jgi:hypothetical protein
MLMRSGAGLQIDAIHTRAICDEIGDRLRDILRRQAGNELPPRLRYLMEQLAELDDDGSPSIVPALDDMMIGQGQTTRLDAAPIVGASAGAVSIR